MQKKVSTGVLLVAVMLALSACPRYKPYLPAEHRQDPLDPTMTENQPGILTGKAGEYCIYGC